MWELDHKESWMLKNWWFWTVVLEKTLESPLDCKEVQPVHPKGNQSLIFIGMTDVEAETPILWLPEAKNWLCWKDPEAGKDWGHEEKGMKEDEMVGYHLGSSENIKQDKQKKKNLNFILGFPGGSDGTESTCLAGHQGSIPGLGRFPGVGHGSPLQYSCL